MSEWPGITQQQLLVAALGYSRHGLRGAYQFRSCNTLTEPQCVTCNALTASTPADGSASVTRCSITQTGEHDIDQPPPRKMLNLTNICQYHILFLASQDALEVKRVTHSLTHSLRHWVSVLIDLTDVTLVSDDTYRRLYWCDPDDPDDPDESYLVMKVI